MNDLNEWRERYESAERITRAVFGEALDEIAALRTRIAALEVEFFSSQEDATSLLNRCDELKAELVKTRAMGKRRWKALRKLQVPCDKRTGPQWCYECGGVSRPLEVMYDSTGRRYGVWKAGEPEFHYPSCCAIPEEYEIELEHKP